MNISLVPGKVSGNPTTCEEVQEIAARIARGERPKTEDVARAIFHLASCQTCSKTKLDPSE